MKSFITILSLLFFAGQSFSASMVEYSGTPKTITASGLDVKVYPDLKVILPDEGAVSLKLSGAGIRRKKVAFVPVNVYVAASYVQDPATLKQGDAIEALKASRARVIVLTLLRAMSGDDISNSFKEALEANGVDLNETAMANVLSQMSFNVKAGNQITLIGYPKKEGGLEKLVMELPTKTIQEEGKDLSLNFWKIWLGTPVDAGMADLKAALIGR